MADFVFLDYSVKVRKAIDGRITAVLHEVAGEVVSATKRNSRVDTGQTKNSFEYKVVESDTEHVAYIGSNNENAIWEEFGTGEFALAGNGRKGGWVYKSDKDGKFYHTFGKTPTRAFWNAYTNLKDAIVKHIQEALRGL